MTHYGQHYVEQPQNHETSCINEVYGISNIFQINESNKIKTNKKCRLIDLGRTKLCYIGSRGQSSQFSN